MARQDPPVPDDLLELADRLHSASVRLLRRLRPLDAETGLSGPRLSLLSILVFRGPATITELAEAEQVKPPTVSRMVKDMAYEGLVTRSQDSDDARVRHVAATERGRTALHRGRQRRVEALATWIGELPASDRSTLARAAEVLQDLGARRTDSPPP